MFRRMISAALTVALLLGSPALPAFAEMDFTSSEESDADEEFPTLSLGDRDTP